MQARPAHNQPQADDTLRGNEGASWPNFWKNGCCSPNRLAAALQEDTPFEETPAGAFLSEQF
jgi:hypothetical protein